MVLVIWKVATNYVRGRLFGLFVSSLCMKHMSEVWMGEIIPKVTGHLSFRIQYLRILIAVDPARSSAWVLDDPSTNGIEAVKALVQQAKWTVETSITIPMAG